MSEINHKLLNEDLVALNGAYQDLQVDVDLYRNLKNSGFKSAPALVEELGAKLKEKLEVEDLESKSTVEEAVQMLGTTLQVYAQSGNYFALLKNLGATDEQISGYVQFMKQLEDRIFDKLDVDDLEVSDGE